MADNDDKISFLLNLDIKDFTEQGLHAKGIIEKIGSSENLTGLLEGLTTVGVVLGTVGIAAYAFKKAIDLTTEGEEIERVNNQFELLAKNVGIVPEKLKQGLEQAAHGLVDTDDLIKIANESLVKMGGSAEKLPQIMEIARKATQVYGGDARTNFQAISEAIANGNTRLLKHYGIIVDAAKAEKDFAAANGVTADTLSDVGKRQAILNAALEQGQKAFAGITEDSKSATTILQTLKVTFSEIGQTFTLAFEKTIGPGIRSFLGTVQHLATSLKLHVQAAIGDTAEAEAAKAILAGKKIDEVAAKGNAATQQSIANSQAVTQASIIDLEKQKKQYQEYRKALDKIDADYYALQAKNVQSLAQIDQLVKQRGIALERQHENEILAIKNNASLTAKQKKMLLAQEDKRFLAAQKANELDNDNYRNQLLDNYVQRSESAFNGIGRAFAANTMKMKKDQADFGKRGNEMWNSLSANATAAFTNMGAQMAQGKDIASATADAMKGFFLGFLGDRAIAEGQLMLLSSIWPPNPLGIAGGTALLALGGALKAAAGSSGAGSTVGSSPSVQAQAAGSAPRLVETSPQTQDQAEAAQNMSRMQRNQRTVQVNIAGNYLETDQTKRMLMDLMRQETDATGFAYNQIGA